jgi:hypothetical protein
VFLLYIGSFPRVFRSHTGTDTPKEVLELENSISNSLSTYQKLADFECDTH